jgi:hypothetical protein
MLASGFDSPAALLDELFEYPAGGVPFYSIRAGPRMWIQQLMQLLVFRMAWDSQAISVGFAGMIRTSNSYAAANAR